jgi:hypothetical protein
VWLVRPEVRTSVSIFFKIDCCHFCKEIVNILLQRSCFCTRAFHKTSLFNKGGSKENYTKVISDCVNLQYEISALTHPEFKTLSKIQSSSMPVALITSVVSAKIALLPKTERNDDGILEMVFVLGSQHLPVSSTSSKCFQGGYGRDVQQFCCESARLYMCVPVWLPILRTFWLFCIW